MAASELYRFSWARLLTSRPVERVARALGNRLMPKWMLRIPYRGYESEETAAWQLMRAIIRRFTSQVRGKTVFILPLPDRAHFIGNLKPIYLDRFATAENAAERCFVLDVLPYFKRLSPGDRTRSYFADLHYSSLGHQTVAQCIADGLLEHCPSMLNGEGSVE